MKPDDSDITAARRSSLEVRRDALSALVAQHEFASIQDLARELGVSEVTVRTDVEALAKAGRLRRIRGGAMRALEPISEQVYEARESSHAAEKETIGRAAAAMIRPGDGIVLDVGTTTMAIARAIGERQDLHEVTVFTPALNIALALEPAIPRIQVVVTGGTLRPQQHSLVEPMSNLILSRIRATIGFIGCNGIDPQSGIMGLSLPDVVLKQVILEASRRRVVVADASKFGQTALVKVCDLRDVDEVLTAGPVDPERLRLIQDAGLAVVNA